MQPIRPTVPTPNLFVVGAAKCATTTIYQMLSKTPGVAMCLRKEPCHFSTDFYELAEFRRTQSLIRKINNQHWLTNRDEYLANFPRVDAQWYGEASTTYLLSKAAAQNLYAFNPDARIVISLRNPIKRAHSEFQMRKFIGDTKLDFSRAIREDLDRVNRGVVSIFEPYIAAGLYAAQVRRYLDLFPRDQVMIEIIDRPDGKFRNVHSKLSQLLSVDVKELASGKGAMANVARDARLPALNNFLYRTELTGLISRAVPSALKARLKRLYFLEKQVLAVSRDDVDFLREVFRSDVDELSAMLGEDLGFWLQGDPIAVA